MTSSSEHSSHNPQAEEPAAPAGRADAVKPQSQAATELAPSLPMPSLAASSPTPEAAPPTTSIPKMPAWHNTNTIVAVSRTPHITLLSLCRTNQSIVVPGEAFLRVSSLFQQTFRIRELLPVRSRAKDAHMVDKHKYWDHRNRD